MAHRILVVDDEKDIVESIQKRLLHEGFEVSIAFDGEEALFKVKDDNPDIVLLDLNMPKLNGFDVLKQIREKYNKKWIPVIIVSAKTDLDSVKQSYGMEADHYLTKPCTMENILRGIRTMISLMAVRKT